ncbi:MAG: ABC transporter substrate-binding protein [Halobacteriaceae archaeon]
MSEERPRRRVGESTEGDRGPSSTRRAALGGLGAGAAATVAGCAGVPALGGSPGGDEGPTAVTYRGRFKRLGLAPAVNDAGVELGTWADDGLDVSYRTASGSSAAAKSVASGNERFGNGGIAAVLQLVEQGAPLVIIGQIADPMGGVVALADSGIRTWTDLEGRTVGRFPFGSTGIAAEAAMRAAGADVSAVEFRNVQPGSGMKLLLSGEIDAMARYFPQMKQRLEYRGKDAVALPSVEQLGHLGVTLYTRQEVIDQEPGLVERFVRGWLQAFRPWTQDLERVIDLYAPKVPGEFNRDLERRTVPALYAAQAPRPAVGTRHGKGWTPEERLRDTVDVFTEAGLLEGAVEPSAVYTNEFIERNHDLAVETAGLLYDALERYDVGPNYI